MTTKNYQQEQAVDTKTAASKLLQRFSTNLGRLSTSVDGIEQMGHRLANTDYPKTEDNLKKGAEIQSEGILSEFEMDINRLEVLNVRLEELGKKFSELI